MWMIRTENSFIPFPDRAITGDILSRWGGHEHISSPAGVQAEQRHSFSFQSPDGLGLPAQFPQPGEDRRFPEGNIRPRIEQDEIGLLEGLGRDERDFLTL